MSFRDIFFCKAFQIDILCKIVYYISIILYKRKSFYVEEHHMKKRKIAIGVVAICLCGISLFVGSTFGGESNTTDVVVKGNTTAVSTLKKYLQNDRIIVGEDFSLPAETSALLLPDTEGFNSCALFQVEGVSDEYGEILFLYDNDRLLVTATPSERTFVKGYQIDLEYKNEKYHNSKNYHSGAFAWRYENTANLILSEDAMSSCSSIWSYNDNKVILIWCDKLNNPIWEDYN